ncbi:MAG: Na+/H+ antiporter subunit E [Eubacteriales bacterium]|nr:Na+/H+ antiporter subunit E [Eubacteriales bacterium]MDD4104356.1 Na+/H+ antiporter subunit E [Eubacteriales bacterium]MDD4709697.1 Na+/H+ antiporter subunit E [Eubacteriales bacterium]NLO15202.1 Na+/H+ antiporter subunit E [Clostridiales bacterium]
MLTAIFFILWIVFNGRITVEVALIGAVISAALSLFTKKYILTDPPTKSNLAVLRNTPALFRYIWLLIREIAQANKAVLTLILSDRREVQPKLAEFRTRLKTRAARVILADSITLTPGTITVHLEEDRYIVHCLDAEYESGLVNSGFEQCLSRIEKSGGKEEAR